mmetsp:Transcript_8486/g.18300  ORF Transcript_8486/g.18300 Transcript_8486/m.18300 type:complete len:100 (+) Transcript_8486:856-1155(+)
MWPHDKSHCAGLIMRLPKQMEPKEVESDLANGRTTADVQNGPIAEGWNHHVLMALATVTRTTFLMTIVVQWKDSKKSKYSGMWLRLTWAWQASLVSHSS